jgi:thiamine biosynthesis lipoprotein
MAEKQRELSASLSRHDAYFSYTFKAMASPCQFLIETEDEQCARELSYAAQKEVDRIEKKFSRYIQGNLCDRINSSNGEAVSIDAECHRMLTFADTCYQISDGMFDVTSGILRRAWKFDCSDRIPTQSIIDELLPNIGWPKVSFNEQTITLQPDMEIDFGGIGKEYAASAAADMCRKQQPDVSVLVNLGGDIQVSRKRNESTPWLVGIENSSELIPIVEGALATSGDAKRYLLKDDVRYSHILNPKSGWPVQNAPASVTTHAPLCIQAGILATLALLHGEGAEQFLKEQDVQYWLTQH